MRWDSMASDGPMSAGTQLKASGQHQQALEAYQQATSVCPDHAAGFYDLGVYYSEQHQV